MQAISRERVDCRDGTWANRDGSTPSPHRGESLSLGNTGRSW